MFLKSYCICIYISIINFTTFIYLQIIFRGLIIRFCNPKIILIHWVLEGFFPKKFVINNITIWSVRHGPVKENSVNNIYTRERLLRLGFSFCFVVVVVVVWLAVKD
jgi:hypothetical protein